MKRYIWLIMSVVLLVGGLYLILKPTVIDHMVINPYVVEKATADMDEVTAEDIAENNARIQSTDDELIQPAGESETSDDTIETAVNADGYTYPVSDDPNIVYDASVVESVGQVPLDASVNYDYMVGEIYMPDVDMRLPILEGVSNENLWVGAGTMKPGQKMGEGNYALAGHHMWDESQLFTPIMNSEIGDKAYVTDKNKVYEYTVTDIFVVQPSDGYVINDIPGEQTLTLVTCTDVWGSERHIVVGELTDVSEYEADAAA